MSFSPNTEHFITLFDQAYLPQGLCLHQSLETHAMPYHLWVLCMDTEVEESLKALSLPNLTPIALEQAENPELLRVKPTRGRGEYCWTMTPFTPQLVFDRVPQAKRATYLDADLYFFSSPNALFKELEQSHKGVLITEHAYAPEYDQTETSGRFCVQFMAFNNTDAGRRVMSWWQDRCVEWCFARHEDGKFGDQKYLDDWPERFQNEVHVLQNTQLTLAPWNARSLYSSAEPPAFYHLHGLKILSNKKVQLYEGYRIGKARRLYDSYMISLNSSVNKMKARQLNIKPQAANNSMTQRIKSTLKQWAGRSVTLPLR